jgi:hypothetical protein
MKRVRVPLGSHTTDCDPAMPLRHGRGVVQVIGAAIAELHRASRMTCCAASYTVSGRPEAVGVLAVARAREGSVACSVLDGIGPRRHRRAADELTGELWRHDMADQRRSGATAAADRKP